jgi:hypothetical protein
MQRPAADSRALRVAGFSLLSRALKLTAIETPRLLR